MDKTRREHPRNGRGRNRRRHQKEERSQVFHRADHLRRAIRDFIGGYRSNRVRLELPEEASVQMATRVVDVVVTPNEVTNRHGTGVIVHKAFADSPDILSIRSRNYYGEHYFGAASIYLNHTDGSRRQAFQNVVAALEGYMPRRVVCIPYYADEVLTALAIKHIYGVPLCIYIMDDNNIFLNGISDNVMRELLDNSDLRLAISPELRDAYESKFELKFWLAPPLVEKTLIQKRVCTPDDRHLESRRGILMGNIWIREWFELLRRTLKESGLRVDWYGNSAQWAHITDEQLAADGIDKRGFVGESELANICRRYPYAVVPSGTLSPDEDQYGRAIAKLSQPTRLSFLLAATNTPIIVLGSEDTAAARFVKRFDIGVVASYDSRDFSSAVNTVVSPIKQTVFRTNAAARAGQFTAADFGSWLWRSLEAGQACDSRFEDLMPRLPSDLIRYIEPPVPKEVKGDFAALYKVMRRLKNSSFEPDFVIDIGASSGVWSHTLKQIFPLSRYILVDPLNARYSNQGGSAYARRNPTFEIVEAAVSNREGETVFHVSPDLYGSSLLTPADFRSYHEITVRVTTANQIALEKRLTGRGILKVDVQCAEHLVLEGASDLLPLVDVVVLELSLVKYAPEAKVFTEMLTIMENLGFRYYDEAGGWRSPINGALLQKDVIFLRTGLYPAETSN